MVEQLVLVLVEEEPPTFANFVAGPNAEAIAALTRTATSGGDAIALWGAEGSGKTHLLRAFVATAAAAGRTSHYVASAADIDSATDAHCIAVDDVDRADADAQARLFTLFNAVRARGGAFVAASRLQPSRLALRDDLRTRLAWGLTFEIRALADADKPAALAVHARQRGFELGDDVIAYLLAHGRRDMRSLTATLAALDRHSLSTRRAITVPLLREWMASSRLPI
ncbi:MAG: DnaA regulatory inactivator Hda [Betaproteobacteria bacterium]